jgi:phosphodiesterase/alkaline phosphatase D-like protein
MVEMLARRSRTVPSLLAACAAALAVAPAAASAGEKGFQYGVVAADVGQRSAILWARANGTGPALAQVSRGRRFGGCKIGRAPGSFKAFASADRDRTVQKRIGSLRPGTKYHYRWCMSGGRHSSTGSFETAPAPGRARTIRFALSGDQDALAEPGEDHPYWNRFQIWNRIRAEDNDFNVLMGDTIYSDTEVPGHGLAQVATTVPQKWRKYRINLGQEPWVRARGSASYYAHWDDHEFINDFSKFENSFPLSVGTVNINGKELYKRGLKAFRNYNPVGYQRKTGIYRSFRWGRNLEIFFLDERSFRSRSADYGGACDNPASSGNADLAPTAPQGVRNAFGALIPSLASPAPPACLAKINDPDRTMLGAAQLARFKRAVKRSTATFKVIFNEVPIQQFYALPYDRWEGYEAERQKLLNFLRNNVKNVVFLTTDDHANLVNDARLKTLEPGGPVDSGIMDITTGPIATANYALEIDDAVGGPYAGLIHSAFFKPVPPNGVGMTCAGMDQFSYAEVTVSGSELKVELKALGAGGRVLDTADIAANPGAAPCGPYVIPRS